MPFLFVTLGFVLIFGCDSKKPNHLETDSISYLASNGSSIIGGIDVPANSDVASFVVGIYDRKNNFICSGSLISSKTILTAAHCIESSASDIVLVFDQNFNALNLKNSLVIRQVMSISLHPDYKNNRQTDIDWSDIALLHFAGTVPNGFKPIEILNNRSLLERGTVVQMAGYGASEVNLEEVDYKENKKFKDEIALGKIVCTGTLEKVCFRVSFLGSEQLRTVSGNIEGFTEKEIRLNENKGKGTCVGDSGGPLFVKLNGQNYLAGLTSRGSSFCDGPAIYTNVVEFTDWIILII